MYECLSDLLLKKEFNHGIIDTTLFIKCKGSHILLFHIFVDDIIFCSTNMSLCREFSSVMQGKFSSALDLQITQTNKDMFISLAKYYLELPKKYDMKYLRSIYTPMALDLIIDKYEQGFEIKITKYRDII